MLRSAKLIDNVLVANELGEGIIWDEYKQTVWWTDIESCILYSYHLASKTLNTQVLPEQLCSFGFIDKSPLFIGAFASGFALFDPATGKVYKRVAVEPELLHTRLNDGRVDRQGRFWSGTMMKSSTSSATKGSLYCLDHTGSWTVKEQGVIVSNSLCWSLDSRKLYFADSALGEIVVYDFDCNRAQLSNRQLFASTPENVFPDGSTIDIDGNLWNAQWGASQIVCYNPNGEVIQRIKLPVSQPTCVSFGGPDMNCLFVTSAKSGLSDDERRQQPNAGAMYIFQLTAKGVPECKYTLDTPNAWHVPV